MIPFLTAFILMLITGSIFILGFHTVTRGEIKKLPNGEEIEEKELLGSWQIFWEQVDSEKRIYYEGDQLEFKLKVLEQLKPAYVNEISFSTSQRKSLFFNSMPSDAEVRDIEFTLNCHVFKNDTVVFLYDVIPVYRFPEWVRKMTNCYLCLSGWMGTLYYFWMLYFYPTIFNIDVNAHAQAFCFWIIYCVSLVFINKLFKENFHNNQINS